MKKGILLTFATASVTLASAQEVNSSLDSIELEELVIVTDAEIGSKFKSKNQSGSNYFISPEELARFSYSDVNRILQSVPGVAIVDEEGFGHRPSIGIRGTAPTRTSKITLMEDGVLIAPAPYIAPEAYYFPTVNRINAFEILKGSSQIQYGPFTTGGAVNLVSTQIPNYFKGKVQLNYGSFNTRNAYFNLGDSHEQFGYLVEYNNRTSDGFKKIDFSDKNTGFSGNDYLAKFRINTKQNASIYQSLTFKIQYSEENANETYLGLTDQDFQSNHKRRYLASANDHIATEHFQFMLTHLIKPSKNIDITTKAYRNTFKRNWYKLQDVRVDGENFSLANILQDPIKYQSAYNLLTATTNGDDNSLRYRANNRSYETTGIQTDAHFKFNENTLKHDLNVGVRYHEESEDRFHWTDGYTIRNKKLLQTSAGVPGTQTNQVTTGYTFAAFALYNVTLNNLKLTPGIRYENMNFYSKNYGTENPDRNENQPVVINQNKVSVVIPGISALYNFTDKLSLFSSVHKGFAPPGVKEGQKAEESINFEIGTRYHKTNFSSEIVFFNNSYSNMLGADSNAAGGTGEGDLFNAGKANVSGAELLLGFDLINESEMKIPITINYTYTKTKLKSDFNSSVEAWGDVKVGDEIPYIPKHVLAASLGFEYKKLKTYLNTRYNGAFRTQAGQGFIPTENKINSFLVFDMAANYEISKNLVVKTQILNLLNNKYAVARVPSGLRPGMPFAIHAGVLFNF